jgi:hypothetical protein
MPICPRCNKNYGGHPALSRRDNHTLICSQCGNEEAMIDYAGMGEFWIGNFRDGAKRYICTFEQAKETADGFTKETGIAHMVSEYIPGKGPGACIYDTFYLLRSRNSRRTSPAVRSDARKKKWEDDPWGFSKAIRWDKVEEDLQDPVKGRALCDSLGIDYDTGKKKPASRKGTRK